MKIAAIIPARKGSKRIKNKNRLLIEGKPMIGLVAEILEQAQIFEQVFLSTDDAVLKKEYQDTLTVLNRPKVLADDHSTAIDMLRYHQANELKHFDLICLIYAHAVNINYKDIVEAISTLKESPSNRLMSICKLPVPLEWTYKINKESLDPHFPNAELIRSQDLGSCYFDAGQFYLFKSTWFEKCELHPIAWHELNPLQSVDLDEPEDLEIMKLFYRMNNAI
jgi:pseudaminic acid cytidylyltransferase